MGPKPLEIFVVAEQFYWAGQLAARIPHEVEVGNPNYGFGRGLPNMPIASIACLAFALELYFKCLIRLGNKPKETGHDLVKLFKKIGVRHQAAIKTYFRQHIDDLRAHLEREYAASGRSVPKPDFDFVLSTSKDAFSRMRYVYEKGIPPDTGWLASEILEGARQAILAKRPDWIRARQVFPAGEIIVRPRPTSHIR
jgi:hypothetical protein